MTVGGHVRSIRNAIARFNEGDLDEYFAAFTEGCLRGAPGGAVMSLAETRAGLELVRSAFADLRLDELLLFGDGRYVCARWLMVGTHTGEFVGVAASGRRIAVENAEIYEFESDVDGLVCASWSFGDPQAMFQQLTGDSPAEAAR